MKTVSIKAVSMPELIKHYGSMKRTSEETGISEMTVARYRFDTEMTSHVIYNGRLYVNRKTSKIIPDIV